MMECPVFGTPITEVVGESPCGSGGDYTALKDGDRFYRVTESAAAELRTMPLDEVARGRMREWLDEEWNKGKGCPEITTHRLRLCRAPA